MPQTTAFGLSALNNGANTLCVGVSTNSSFHDCGFGDVFVAQCFDNANKKDDDRINAVAAAFIARSPFVGVSSAGANGAHGRAEDRWRGKE